MQSKFLVIGYGNPGRLDDGLGPALAERVGRLDLPGVRADADYQLVVEDAAAIAECDDVIFADASVSGREPFEFRPVHPALEMSFSSHSLAPASVLALARAMFGARARGFTLGIRGYEFDGYGEALSPAAQRNLEAAVQFVRQWTGGDARQKETLTHERG
jgi:hydrogenase maturation protease